MYFKVRHISYGFKKAHNINVSDHANLVKTLFLSQIATYLFNPQNLKKYVLNLKTNLKEDLGRRGVFIPPRYHPNHIKICFVVEEHRLEMLKKAYPRIIN